MADDMHVLSNSLADLAARIRVEHNAVGAAARKSIEHAMAAGQMLIEAKAQLDKHGRWAKWLEQHCGVPARTASHYMRLARNRTKIEAEISNVADLTVRGALALLAPEAEEAVDEAVPDVLWPGEIWLDIAVITVRPDLYPRLNSPIEVIERYTHFVDDVPAIEVNQRNELIDGFMRLKAAERIGRKRIRAFVTHVEDELTHFMIATYRNARHGLQLPLIGGHGELELRDERRKKLAIETEGQSTPTPWHLKPNTDLPDWLVERDHRTVRNRDRIGG